MCALRTFCDRWQEFVAIELIALPRSADKAITLTACKFRGDGPASTDVNGNGMFWTIVDRGVARPIVFPLEGDQFARPQLFDHGHSFAQTCQALLWLWPLSGGGRHPIVIIAFPDTQHYSPPIKRPQPPKAPGHDGRLIAESSCEEPGSQGDATCA